MTPAQIKEAVALGPGIYAEFVSPFGNQDPSSPIVKQTVEGIRAAGIDHAFVSSDTGQINSVFQPDALAKCAKVLRANGFTEQELAKLFKVNPAKILGLTPPPGA
jgi:predicted metal-dependent TIM-barrel fold hydrolase